MLSVLGGQYASSTSTACAAQDPHLHFAFGGSADFRGRHMALYTFLSAPGVVLNVKTEDSTFKLHGKKLLVDGSFMTEAHLTAVSLPKRKFANVSFWASELNEQNTGRRVVNGTCGGHKFTLGLGGRKQCEEIELKMSFSTATWATRDWIIKVRGNHVHDRVTGPEHRLDISISAKSGGEAAAASLPHGLVGQSFATVGLLRNGRKDVYPASGHIRTEAMAEGAIDGEANLYEVTAAFDTRFAFSRFDAPPAKVTSHLAGALAATAEASAVDVGGGAGGVEAAAVEATLGRQRPRRLAECIKNSSPSPPSSPDAAASSSVCGTKLLEATSQPTAGWTICYILGTSPYTSTPCNQLVPDPSAQYGCWHYDGGYGGWGSAPEACSDNVQHDTSWDHGAFSSSHSFVVCIKKLLLR